MAHLSSPLRLEPVFHPASPVRPDPSRRVEPIFYGGVSSLEEEGPRPRVERAALPSGVRRFFKNRLYDAIGLVLFTTAMALAICLGTWRATDPSLSNAIEGAAYNYMGAYGAIVADQFFQILGFASLLCVWFPMGWSVAFFCHLPPRSLWKRGVLSVICVIFGAVLLAFLPAPSGWVLGGGVGGTLGTVLREGALFLFSFLMPPFFASLGIVFLCLWGLVWSGCAALSWPVPGFLKPFSKLAWRRRVPIALQDPTEIKPVVPSLPRRLWKGLCAQTLGIGLFMGRAIGRLWAPPSSMGRRTRRIEPLLVREEEGFSLCADEGEEEPDLGDPDPGYPGAHTAPHQAFLRPAPTPAPAHPVVSKAVAPKPSREAFVLPPLEFLKKPLVSKSKPGLSEEALEQNARLLEGVLEDFGVRGEIINVRPGPVVTLYELEPAPGIKSSRVIGLADDIARSMCALSVRVAVVPGKNVIGIEMPNEQRETVYLRELLSSSAYREGGQALCLALGKNIEGEPIYADLARMPHVLIAGTTGSGKSVGINAMILSLLYRMPPERCRLIMIDPKMLELSVYEGIPHLLSPVVTDPKKAVVALRWAVREMEDRYRKMSKLGVRNIDGFNARVQEATSKGEPLVRTVQTGYDADTGEPVFEQEEMALSPIPYIVVVIDEMADLMMVAGKEIEGAVQRLAQMARAAGIHVIMATQRPSVDVITGTIKANFPTRVSFQVTSKIDSRTILGEQGAEQLLGQGDMLYMAGGGRIVRLHAAFVSDGEVEKIVEHLKSQGMPDYIEAITEEEFDDAQDGGGLTKEASGDTLYDQACDVVLRDKKVSTSYIQRRLQIGYNKAASLVERMEQEGLISAPNATGKREILAPMQEDA